MISIDFNNGVVQATPVVGAAATDAVGRLILGLSLNEWFYISAILYSLAMTFIAVYKAIKEKPTDNKE
ncbi:type II holin [Stutzerimonas stutzeri]|uniref:type II holin n=1 Tax=Stutzerimonas stutzeri TaxID=316 RepID=UPI0030AAB81D